MYWTLFPCQAFSRLDKQLYDLSKDQILCYANKDICGESKTQDESSSYRCTDKDKSHQNHI